MKGYIRAHREYGLTPFPGMLVSFTTEEVGSTLNSRVEQLLQTLRDKPTAIFCYNDLIALDVLMVLRKLNYKVPEDISIVGYDNSHLAEATEINLTTVEHPKKELGEKAAHLLLDVIEGKSEFNGEPYTFKPKLIIRNSTAKPAKPEE